VDELTRAQQIDSLGRALAHLDPHPPPDFAEFTGLFRNRVLDKGEWFARAGSESDTVAFVNSGVARLFYVRDDGKEFNKGFSSAPDFLAVLDALILREPSRLSIQALTPMQLFVAPYAQLAAFFERDIYWQRIQRRIVEQLYVKKVRREASLLMESAGQRYRAFLREHPVVSEAVPDYHVAAYLGITPEALSRLKRKIPCGS